MALVIKKWYGEPTPNGANNYVEIQARESGLLSWLLSLMKVDPTYHLIVGYEKVMFASGSLSGYRRAVVPTASVSSTFFGYHKPWKAAAAIVALFLFIFAFPLAESGKPLFAFIAFVTGLVIAGVYYLLNKELMIGFSEVNGLTYSMVLKRSVIENKEIDEQAMELVTNIITTLVQDHKLRLLGAPAK